MGDVVGDIFGGGGGGGFEATQVPNLSPGQGNLLDLITSFLSGQFQGGQLQGVTPFQGTRPGEVPFGPLQQQAFGLAGGLGQGIGAGIDLFGQTLGQFDPTQGQGFLGQAGGAIEQGLGFDPTQDILRAFEPSRQLALNTFQQDIIPNLLERFGATSGASGSLNQALSEAGADLSLGLSAQTAPFIGQAALARPGQQFQGAGQFANLAGIPGQLAGQGAQLGGQGLQQLLGIGGLQRTLPQGIAAANQARFGEAQGFANPLLQLLGPALGTPAFQAFQSQAGQSPDIFGSIAGLFGSGGAFGQGGAFGPTPSP